MELLVSSQRLLTYQSQKNAISTFSCCGNIVPENSKDRFQQSHHPSSISIMAHFRVALNESMSQHIFALHAGEIGFTTRLEPPDTNWITLISHRERRVIIAYIYICLIPHLETK